MSGATAERTYALWVRMIEDEALGAAVVAGEPERVAAERGLSAEDLEVLRAFGRERGTKWNLENLRFRTAQETADSLVSYLPRTMKMLTLGHDGWLQDLSYEYLSLNGWRQLGHLRFSECERFAVHAKERIARRRPLGPHFETVLEFELGVVRLLKKTASIPKERWPAAAPAALDDEALGKLAPRPSEAMALIDLKENISEWIRTGDPLKGAPRPGAITALVVVPSLRESHQVQVIAPGAKELLRSCDGKTTVAELQRRYAEEVDAAEVAAVVRRWLDKRVLWT